MVNGICYCFCGVCLLGTDGDEADEELVVDGHFNINQGSNNALDAPDTLVVERQAEFVFGGILRCCIVNDGAMFVRGQLGFLGGRVTVPTKDVLYVTVNCKAECADTGLVVPS